MDRQLELIFEYFQEKKTFIVEFPTKTVEGIITGIHYLNPEEILLMIETENEATPEFLQYNQTLQKFALSEPVKEALNFRTTPRSPEEVQWDDPEKVSLKNFFEKLLNPVGTSVYRGFRVTSIKSNDSGFYRFTRKPVLTHFAHLAQKKSGPTYTIGFQTPQNKLRILSFTPNEAVSTFTW